MFDLTQFFIASAHAQDAAQSAAMPAPPSNTPQLMLFAFIFILFYFFIMRPQQKKQDEMAKMIKALTRGDRIITAGGVHGKIVKLDGDDNLIVEIADGVQIKVVRNTVTALAAKTEPAAAPKPANTDNPAVKKD